MSTPEITQLLQDGIAAAKAGQPEQARACLLAIIAQDEHHEQAWLWLSGVVDTPADRRTCLENVLTINPDNQLAQRGLAKLNAQLPPTETPPTPAPPPSPAAAEVITIRREHPSLSLAGAILYPERQVTEWQYRDPAPLIRAADVQTASTSTFADAWSRGGELCAFCAHEVEITADLHNCPRCGRRLRHKAFRYPEPSSNIHIFWVLLAGVGQLFLIRGLYVVIIQRTLWGAVLSGLMMLLFFGLAIGIYWRQAWAYFSSLVILALFLLVSTVQIVAPFDLSALDTQLTVIDPLISHLAVGQLVQSMGNGLRNMQLFTAGLALFYAIFQTAPDFERIDTMLTAHLDKGLALAGDYHTTARTYARKEMWATAVLHWQRASAKEPHNPVYLHHLGAAYARLGFPERGLDVLQSAQQFSRHPEQQTQLQRLIDAIKSPQPVDGIDRQ